MSENSCNEKSAFQQIKELKNKLPKEVSEDINGRMNDWFQSGGEENDNYIKQQLRYAKRILNYPHTK